jgi:D-glycero-D-manno-heptose 1,7-bisphosphate phosphatase
VTTRQAVFLDRDGTMIHDRGYLRRLEDLQWFPWSIDAIRMLNRAGFAVCVTTNQGGIGKGLYNEGFVERTHAEMSATLAASGGHIDGWFYCPHHPRAVEPALRVECDCRKPKPGMIHQAAKRFDLDLTRSFVVGDKMADVGLGNAVGAQSILVKTGYGQAEASRYNGDVPGAAHVAETLAEAVSWILTASGFPREGL